MAFPSSPVNNQMAIVNGIVYSYESATNTWTRKNNTSANIITVNSANITSNTASISTTTGALKVTGGVGITGNVVAGAVYTNSYFYANGASISGGTGYTGSAGSSGYTGSAGNDGAIGYTGSAGTGGGGGGYTGSAGSTGYTGSMGYTGSAGSTGYTGSAAYNNVVPNAQTTAYTLVIGDVGKYINITTGGVTVPSGVFSSGDVVTIYNMSASAQTITQGASVTMYLVGTATTGNRTLAQRGLATVLCVGTNEFVVAGGGLT